MVYAGAQTYPAHFLRRGEGEGVIPGKEGGGSFRCAPRASYASYAGGGGRGHSRVRGVMPGAQVLRAILKTFLELHNLMGRAYLSRGVGTPTRRISQEITHARS